MMKVDTLKKAYVDALPSWKMVRDCVAGSAAIKKETTTYLPFPNPQDRNQARYNAYILRALFYNATAKTLDGLSGAVNRKPPLIELPSQIEYLRGNVDGSGTSLIQQAKDTLDDVIQVGRAGLLVDFPRVGEEPVTLQEEIDRKLRSNIIHYKAEDIINWREAQIGADSVVSLIVLKEQREYIGSEVFDVEERDVYRVLALDENGRYYQEVYMLDDSGAEQNFVIIEERSYPTNIDGRFLDRIPFVFVGSRNLTPNIDKAPLLDLAEVNIAHYRNSADFEEMCFMIGQPTLVMTGLTEQWIANVFKGKGVTVGARSSLQLPEGASAQFLQLNESQIADKAMQRKEEQMVAIGARLISQNPSGVEAAETLRLRMSGEASILANIASNVSEAYTVALEYTTDFMGGEKDKAVFELNMDFFADSISPDVARMYMEAWQKGVIALGDVRDAYRKGELINKERTDEDIDKELEQEQTDAPNVNFDMNSDQNNNDSNVNQDNQNSQDGVANG